MSLTYKTLVAYVGCGQEPKERTGHGMNPIRKTKDRLDQKSLLKGEWACDACKREGVHQPCNYRLWSSIVSLTLIKITREMVGNEEKGVNYLVFILGRLVFLTVIIINVRLTYLLVLTSLHNTKNPRYYSNILKSIFNVIGRRLYSKMYEGIRQHSLST